MRFCETALAGVIRVVPEPQRDERGAFVRLHCPLEFDGAGFPFAPTQTSLSRNPILGTLRGLHYHPAPDGEVKLVRAVRGCIFDVALDLRPQSSTFLQWIAAELSAENMLALLIPEGVAHGFLTLEPDTDVLYQISPLFSRARSSGVRWNDPAFDIRWPFEPALMSQRDASYPTFKPGEQLPS
jgi:dTDP-4-dehydrorhamnose 3,5-epimerase